MIVEKALSDKGGGCVRVYVTSLKSLQDDRDKNLYSGVTVLLEKLARGVRNY
jgi:hypothetical protein